MKVCGKQQPQIRQVPPAQRMVAGVLENDPQKPPKKAPPSIA
jgi:hypothetical protein